MEDKSKFDCKYLVPINLYKFNDIFEYEKEISKKHNQRNDFQAAIYKFNEKRSLIEYYKSYYKNINNGTIFNYLDMKQEYYGDINYIKEINNMLKNFSEELEKYFEILGVEYEKF